MREAERDGIAWLEAELPGAKIAFTTRGGGSSEAPYDSLNLGLHVGDDPDVVVANRIRLQEALRLKSVHVARQVHGADLMEGGLGPSTLDIPHDALPEADGLFSREGGGALAVLVADCLPVALSGPAGIAMLHCGWRGMAAGIIARGVNSVSATAAVVGPGIGFDSYQVGEEVLTAFEDLGDEVTDGHCLDLAAVAVRLLQDAGVADIQTSGLCTFERQDLFFSHRRDGERTGRQAGLVWRD